MKYKIRNISVFPMPKGDTGIFYNHLEEVQNALVGITKASQAIERMLDNPNLSSDARDVLEYAYRLAQKFIIFSRFFVK